MQPVVIWDLVLIILIVISLVFVIRNNNAKKRAQALRQQRRRESIRRSNAEFDLPRKHDYRRAEGADHRDRMRRLNRSDDYFQPVISSPRYGNNDDDGFLTGMMVGDALAENRGHDDVGSAGPVDAFNGGVSGTFDPGPSTDSNGFGQGDSGGVGGGDSGGGGDFGGGDSGSF